MSEDKFGSFADFEEQDVSGDDTAGGKSRARNRTVMLSPEMTGQVRAMLQDKTGDSSEEVEEGSEEAAGTYVPPISEWQGLAEEGEEENSSRSTSIMDASDLVGDAIDDLIDDANGGFGQSAEEDSPFDPFQSVAAPMDFSLPVGGESPVVEQEVVTPAVEREQVETPVVESEEEMSGKRFADALSELGAPVEATLEAEAVVAPAVTAAASVASVASVAEPFVSEPFVAEEQKLKKAKVTMESNVSSEEVSSKREGWHAAQGGEAGKLVGLLMSYDVVETGEIFEVRVGRFLLTSKPSDNGAYLFIDDESVSPLHAIMKVHEDAKIQVLDQLSEFGTAVKRAGEKKEEEVSGNLVDLEHGDMLRLGKRSFVVVQIPQVKS